MWIVICGTPGAGKNFVADVLQKDGFVLVKEAEPKILQTATAIEIELRYAFVRLRTQMEAAVMMNRKNLLTMRSFWDSIVFAELALKFHKITQSDFDLFRFMYDQICDQLAPPSAVLWMKTPKMSAYDRMLLRSGSVAMNDLEFTALQELYENFMSRVKVPILEIDASERAEAMKKNLEFGLASLKATKSGEQSIWARRFFY